MKKLLIILLLSPFFAAAQTNIPRFENDTLYTSGGYRIYKGQTLHFAQGTSAAGYFKYLKFHPGMTRTDTYILQNSTLLVERIRNFKYSGNDVYSARISGTATLADGKKMPVDLNLDFEKAATGFDGNPAELILPAEFKPRPTVTIAEIKQPGAPVEVKIDNTPADLRKIMVADEIKKLFDLHKSGALTKEEYETQKKKLLDRQ
jgi:hypothetical protein